MSSITLSTPRCNVCGSTLSWLGDWICPARYLTDHSKFKPIFERRTR